jgi:hypothetical protein
MILEELSPVVCYLSFFHQYGRQFPGPSSGVCVCVPDMKSQQGDRTPHATLRLLLLLLLQADRGAGPLRGGQKRMNTFCVCVCVCVYAPCLV